MRSMLRLVLPALVLALGLGGLSSCATPTVGEDTRPAPVPYVLCILKTGPAQGLSQDESTALQTAHLENITRLAKEGKILIAGPFGRNADAPTMRGIFLFDVATVEEARALGETDPAVAAGVFDLEFHQVRATPDLRRLTEMEEVTRERLAATKPEGQRFDIREYRMHWFPTGHDRGAALAAAARPNAVLDLVMSGDSAGQHVVVTDGALNEEGSLLLDPETRPGATRPRHLSWWASSNLARRVGITVE